MSKSNPDPNPAPDPNPTPVAQPSNAIHQSSLTGLRLIFGLLMLWAILIATGTLLFGDNTGWQKPLLVLFPMTVLLCLWAWLLRRRNASLKKRNN